LPGWTRLTLTVSAFLFWSTVIAVSTPYGRAVLSLGPQPIGAFLVFGTLSALVITRRAREEEPRLVLPLELQAVRGKAA